MQYVLTINAGSSSLKVAVFEASSPIREIHAGLIEDIGEEEGLFTTKTFDGKPPQKNTVQVPTHAAATDLIVEWLEDTVGVANVIAVGHRIVHGGETYTKPQLLNNRVCEELKTLQNLDPDHLPAALQSIKELRRHFPNCPHVGCFDTAFYKDIPMVAKTLAVPRRLQKFGVRRYGFHGLSYSYLLSSFAEHEGFDAAHGRVVMAHLGSGVSLAAVKNGKPIDMTMGFTPASGVPMSTRSGDLDPGVVWYLHRISDQGPQQFNHMVNKESGLLGISETTADMHTLLDNQHDDPRAAEAVELFCYHITKTIGSFAAAMGGIDSLIFAGGMGERSPEIRRRICKNLAFLGIELDSERNKKSARLISREGAGTGVHVIPTNEELMIARQTIHTIKEEK
ncbi:MAG: acetate/propionate family kinase [Candidatus Saccharimonadales bacterium]